VKATKLHIHRRNSLFAITALEEFIGAERTADSV